MGLSAEVDLGGVGLLHGVRRSAPCSGLLGCRILRAEVHLGGVGLLHGVRRSAPCSGLLGCRRILRAEVNLGGVGLLYGVRRSAPCSGLRRSRGGGRCENSLRLPLRLGGGRGVAGVYRLYFVERKYGIKPEFFGDHGVLDGM